MHLWAPQSDRRIGADLMTALVFLLDASALLTGFGVIAWLADR